MLNFQNEIVSRQQFKNFLNIIWSSLSSFRAYYSEMSILSNWSQWREFTLKQAIITPWGSSAYPSSSSRDFNSYKIEVNIYFYVDLLRLSLKWVESGLAVPLHISVRRICIHCNNLKELRICTKGFRWAEVGKTALQIVPPLINF